MKYILPVLRQKSYLRLTSLILCVVVASGSVFMAIQPAFAATGINQTINFQGKLVGSTGLNVADSTYSVVFTLYDASSGGTNLWDETQSVSTTDGIFQVQLGSVDTTLGNVDFNTDNLYLGIKVGADAEMTPRIRFAAVPYAFNAQKVAGLTVTNTTGTLTIPNGKTIQFADSFTTTGGNALTLATTGTTSITLPTTGTLLTNTATSSQTITSTQTSGTILGLTDTTNITGATTGLAVTMSGTGAFDQTGLSFNLSGASGSNTNDIVGSGGTWKVSRTGDLTVNSCTGCTGGLANYWRLANGAFSPVNDTADLLLGGNATASAKIRLIGINGSNTPTASISANTTNNAAYLDGLGNLGTTNKQTLTLGSASTGNISIGTDANARTVTIGNNTGASALTFTSGTAAQTFTSSATSGTAFSLVGNSVNTGTGLGLTANGLTNGNAVSVTSTATALGSGKMLNISKTGASGSTAFTGDIANIAYSQTFNGGTALNHTGNVMDISRAITLNAAQTHTISGALMTLSDSATQSLGTLNSSADVLAISQSYAANTGAALNVTSATGTGFVFRANDDGTLSDSTPFVIDGGGQVGIGTTSPLASLDARGILGTTPVASFSGSTAMASLVVDQSGVGDIFSASKSGASKFTILNNGNISMNNYNNCTMLTTIGTVLTCGSAPAASTQYVRLNNGAFSFVNDTADFLIGNTSSASAKFAVLNVNSGTPTASVSAGTNGAAYLTAAGTLQTTANQTLTLGGNSTGNIVLMPANGSGRVGIGTATPNAALSVVNTVAGQAALTLRAHASQSTSPFVIEDSGGGTLFSVDQYGGAYVSNGLSVDRYAGIGTSASSGTQLRIQSLTASDVGFYTAGVNGQTADLAQYLPVFGTVGAAFDESANLRIGVSAPDTGKLNVTGAYTGKALAIFNETGNQDIFTASKSGATKFAINNAGNVRIANFTSTDGLITADVNGVLTQNANASLNSFGDLNTRYITTNATVEARTYQANENALIVNQGSTSPTAAAALIKGGTTPGATADLLQLQNSGSTTLARFNRNGQLVIQANGGTTPNASISGATSFASQIVDQAGVGDIFTASKSGATKFTILNNGDISMNNYNNCGMLTTTGTILTCSAAPSAGTQYVRLNNGAFSFVNDTADYLFGSTASTSAKFKLSASGTSPVASVAGTTSNAAMVIDNTGTGDLFAASKSGSTKVAITNTGTLAVGSFTRASAATTPKDQLHLWGNGTLGSNAIVHFGDVANDSNAYIKEATTGDSDQLELGGRQGLIFATGTNTSYGFERMRIDASGNVAINNTGTAQATFDVRGISGTNPVASVSGTTSRAAFVVDNNGVGDLFTASKSGLTRFVIDNSGNVKIGTQTSGARLQVTGNSGYGVLTGAGAGGGNTIDGTLNGVANETLWLNSISGQDVYIVPNGGGLGVGTADTSNGKLSIAGTYTDAASGYAGLYAAPTFSQTGNSSNAYSGLHLQALYGDAFNLGELNGSSNYASYYGTGALTLLRGSYSQASTSMGTTGTASYVQGSVGDVQHYGVSTIAEATGLTGTVSLRSSGTGNDGEITSAIGVVGYIENNLSANTGTIGTGTAIYAAAPTASANAPITTTYGVQIDNQGSAGVTNATGLYVAGQSGASSTNYAAIFQGGRIGIGTTSPTTTLDIVGNGLNAGTTAVTSVTGNTSFATMVVNNNGNGDIFTASKSGAPRFSVTNQGGLRLGTSEGSSGNCLLSGGAAAAATWGSCAAGSSPFNVGSGMITEANTTNDFLVGGTATSSAKLAVTGMNGGANGQGTNYRTTTSLPANNIAGQTVYSNGYVYFLGGDSTTTNGVNSIANTYYAKINGDGSFGSWVATTPLPAQRQAGMAIVMKGYIYYVGGNAVTSGTPQTSVYYARLNTDGTIGAWNTTAVLPGARSFAGITSGNGYIYVTGGTSSNGFVGGTGVNTVYYAKPNGDGTISSWNSSTNTLKNTNGWGVWEAGTAVVNGYLYVVGGDDATLNSATQSITYSKLDPTTGAPGPFIGLSNSLPVAIDSIPANLPVVNGTIYVYGHATNGNMITITLNEDGSVNTVATQTGAWQGTAIWLPAGLAINGNLYAMGGMNGAQSTIYSIVKVLSTPKVQLNASLDLVGLTNKNNASGSATGASIFAGNISSTGNLDISGNAQIWNGASIRGILSGDQIYAGGLNDTSPTASISANSNFAAMVVNNNGRGDLMTASSSGLTRFTMANNGSVLFEGDTITSIGTLNGTAPASQTNQAAVTNAIGDQGSLIPNAGFESNLTVTKTGNTADAVISDGWVSAATMSAAVIRVASDSAKGSSSMMFKLNNSQNTSIYSVCMPLALGNANLGAYNLMFYARATTATGPVVRGFLDGYTTQANCQSDTGRVVSAAQGANITTAWAKYGGTSAISNLTNAKWARARIYVGCPAAGCGTGNQIFVDAVRLIESSLTGGVDYAENYPIDPANKPEEGDVVSLYATSSAAMVRPASQYMDQSAIGVVSTNPGMTLDDGSMGENKVPVALAGRIPTKVSTKNGEIYVGDYLTASDIPGVAVKAIHSGPVIGQAMEGYSESDASKIGKVVMFVKNSYYNGMPVGLDSGLSMEDNQDDLAFLGHMVTASQKIATSSASKTKISADRLMAGLEVIAPKVTTDTLQVNTIKSAGKDLGIELTDDGLFVIKNASGEATVKFDAKGNAFFSGTVIAGKFVIGDGLASLEANVAAQEDRLAKLEEKLATVSATPTTAVSVESSNSAETTELVKTDNLSVAGLATVSANLRVQGNGLIEGILNVVDTLTVSNFIVNKLATFFGDVVFHSDVIFKGTPYFNADTAGYVTIAKGSDKAEVKFTKPYKNEPVVNASVVTTKLSDDAFKKHVEENTCEADKGKDMCEQVATQEALEDSMPYIIASRSKEGFTILLSQPATQDLTFSWSALAVIQAEELVKGGDR